MVILSSLLTWAGVSMATIEKKAILGCFGVECKLNKEEQKRAKGTKYAENPLKQKKGKTPFPSQFPNAFKHTRNNNLV